jgi:ABC-type Fe3+/spermidine/putrescine transport system ATPase subunit
MNVELAVRPERIALAQEAENQNALIGKISDMTYLGDHTRITLELEDGSSCYFMSKPMSSQSSKRQLIEGKSIKISWPIDAGILLQS